ncbi:unnamed protein product, partial [Prorocentrum cordatum]
EQAAGEATQRWFRAWAIAPDNPAAEVLRALSTEIHKKRHRSQRIRFKQIDEDMILGPTTPPSADELRLDAGLASPRAPRGARSRLARKGRAVAMPELVQPLALGRARASLPVPPAHPMVGGEHYGEWLRDLRTELMLQKLSEGARSGHEGGLGPWLQGRGRGERTSDEDALIDFVVIMAVALSRTEGAVKQKLFAIRYARLMVGYRDPLLHWGRLWTTLAGLKRKRPVTPRMLLWLKQHIHADAGLSQADAAALFAAVLLAFFFLLRASEYLVVAGRSRSVDRVVPGEDLEARLEGERVGQFAQGSKTDQYNVGTVRNQYATHSALCPVEALAAMQAQHPQRFDCGAEARLPLFRWASGVPVKREEVQHFLALAGLAAGLKREEIGSRSLRIGGATAKYRVTDDLAKVQRYGRWASDSFHAYLWETHEPQRDVARRMANDHSELTTPAAKPQERAAGASARRAPPRGLSALGAAAAAATTLGQAAAASQELAVVEEDKKQVSVRLAADVEDITVAIPLEIMVKVIISLVVVLATTLAMAWDCCGEGMECSAAGHGLACGAAPAHDARRSASSARGQLGACGLRGAGGGDWAPVGQPGRLGP